jgi:peptide/nickel transport system ATP-binding protein
MGLVGESGSGKTTLARALLGLEATETGSVELAGRRLEPRLAKRLRTELRLLQAVSQSPDQAFNPYRSLGASLVRPLIRLAGLDRRRARATVPELLRSVGLPPEVLERSPGQLSGGERQRAAIARAFACRPAVILCDEATSSLDVSVQALVLNLLRRLQSDSGSAYLFITHDLAVVAHLADRIAVMYLGELLEVGRRRDVLGPPYHPYTEALLAAFPSFGGSTVTDAGVRISNEIPSPVDRPGGCPFHTRCPRVLGTTCREEVPPWRKGTKSHAVRCHIPLDELAELQEAIFDEADREGGR